MRWTGRRQSENLEDRRGMGAGGKTAVGGIGGIVLVLVFAWLTGADPLQLLEQLGTQANVAPGSSTQVAADDDVRRFVSTLLADTEDVWTDVFAQSSRRYTAPRLVLYSGQTQIPGGYANAATGPFYLPNDQTVYLDFSFFETMRKRFGAGGDFAAAYVVAHEIGHHVQKLLGLTDWMQQQRESVSEAQYNDLSVRLELQADFLAGMWAHHAQKRWNILEPGDVDEVFGAASAVGDDRMQKATRGRVVPDSFTHGTAEQRSRWFKKGFESGRMSEGNTFQLARDQL